MELIFIIFENSCTAIIQHCVSTKNELIIFWNWNEKFFLSLYYLAECEAMCMFKALHRDPEDTEQHRPLSMEEFYHFYEVLDLTWIQVHCMYMYILCWVYINVQPHSQSPFQANYYPIPRRYIYSTFFLCDFLVKVWLSSCYMHLIICEVPECNVLFLH